MLAKKISKNQITLPKEIVKAFPDADYFDVSIKDNAIRLMPVKITPVKSSLDSVREKIKKLGLTEKEVREAIQWARSRKR
ncbi:MAG: AbrB/MazE/SpoVT family DNA-binding domain-containing protein [Deltaproteobacteria bacterium]|nr:AbrB/MazE/SpoVT family DNA-binding domain-containing protein [Deltaproteobacteria bacterium]